MASSVKYHKTYLKLHSEYEKYAYPLIKKALDEQIDAVSKFIDADNFDNLEFYIQFLINQKPLYDTLEMIYKKVGVSAATFSYDWIRNSVPKSRKDFIIDFFNPEWSLEMAEYFRLIGGTKVQGIDQTTMERIQAVLADILEQNLSRREQARLLQETLNSPEFNRARSLVIARTESTTAANYGINMGAESSDYEVAKFWINTKDKRTRRSHLAMTQDRIAINQPFIVGGIPMMYPGEVGAPAAEVVNCRCVMATEALLDADGLPILKPRKPPYLAGSNAINLPKLPKPINKPIIDNDFITEYKPSKTLNDAKNQSIKIINNNTPIKITAIEVDPDLTLDLLNSYNKQLIKLTNAYNFSPNYNKNFNAKLSFKSTDEFNGAVYPTTLGNISELNFGSINLVKNKINDRINGSVYKNESGNYVYGAKSQVDKENLNIATLTHEFAHFISYRNNRLIGEYPLLKNYWSEIDEVRKKYNSEINKYVKNYDIENLKNIYLGNYASTKSDEFVAEAFTEYQLKSNPSKYALQVGKIIDKYFKKK